jgi:hypothetical protein
MNYQEREGILWRPLSENVYGLFAAYLMSSGTFDPMDLFRLMVPLLLVFVSFCSQGVLIWYLWTSSGSLYEPNGNLCRTDSVLKVWFACFGVAVKPHDHNFYIKA